MRAYPYNLALKFKEVVELSPEREAIRFPDGVSYSYIELDRLSDILANALQRHGLRPGEVVGIINEKSIYGYALMIACLKTGVVYTNIDGTIPWLRLKRILS
ncbi:MAG: AMP-binding protein, partial [Cyclobacteriaceae bacterium]